MGSGGFTASRRASRSDVVQLRWRVLMSVGRLDLLLVVENRFKRLLLVELPLLVELLRKPGKSP